MRLALIAPLWETVPPTGYGGIERVVDLLARGLAARGHEVTLFATGDSTCPVPGSWTEPQALRRLGFDSYSATAAEATHLAHAFSHHPHFDVMHNHVGPMGIAFAIATHAPSVTTLHGPLLPESRRHHLDGPRHGYVAISEAQRASYPDLGAVTVIPNGIDTATYAPGLRQGYLLYLGRISPEKGVHLAIEVAHRTGWPLVLAGKVDPFDQAYFEAEIAPHLGDGRVRLVGEVAGQSKREVLQGALALLHLVQWPEPFGLTMVEAMASGVPVIGCPRGSVPEVVTHGVTGFLVPDVAGAVAALGRLGELDPRRCRQEAVTRFDASVMVARYEACYRAMSARHPVA